MTTVFPGSIDTYSTKTDRGIIYHNYINDLQDAVVALETYARDWTVFNVKSAEFGAVGNGVTDDTAAINAAIAAANAETVPYSIGALVYFPPGTYVVSSTLTTPTAGVTLQGLGALNGGNGAYPSVIRLTSTTVPLFSMASAGSGSSIRGLGLFGSGGTTLANKCIVATALSNFVLDDCYIYNFGGSAMDIGTGGNFEITNNLAHTCLLGHASLAAVTGVFELGCGETFVYNNNLNGPITPGAHSAIGNGYLAVVHIKNNIHHWRNNTVAFGHHGMWVDASVAHDFMENRFEFNQGYGLYSLGSQTRFIGNRFQDNSQGTTNTYPHMRLGDDSGLTAYGYGNTIVGNVFMQTSATHIPTYGLEVAGINAGTTYYLRTVIAHNVAAGAGFTTALYNIKTNNVTPISVDTFTMVQTLTDAATVTPNAQAGDIWELSAAAGRTLAAPINAMKGQRVTLSIKNNTGGAITTTFNAAYKMSGYTDPAAGKTVTVSFYCYDGTNFKQIGAPAADLTI